MTFLLVYATIAALLILVVAYLVRSVQAEEPVEPVFDKEHNSNWWNSFGLRLGERIFDSSDYFWLRDQLSLPRLAEALAQHRRQLAIHWLKALRQSFVELIRTPGDFPHAASGSFESWHLLWLTLRIQYRLGYALLIVRLFGPYAPLVPSAGRTRTLLALIFGKDPLHVRSLHYPL